MQMATLSTHDYKKQIENNVTYQQSQPMKNPSPVVAVGVVKSDEGEILISMATGENEQNQNSHAVLKNSVLQHIDLPDVSSISKH